MKSEFTRNLRSDLRFPLELEQLFDGIDSAASLAEVMCNKDSFVKNRIDSCGQRLEGAGPAQLAKQGFITVKSGEIITKKPFAFQNSFQRWGITVKGPVVFEENVTIERSTITGPAYISKNSKIFDSHLRGTRDGALYIGENCNVWDFSEINRSLIGDSSMMHTCNINDSIIGPNSNFGATHTIPPINAPKIYRLLPKDRTMMGRLVVANYSLGNNIRILDPTTDNTLQINATHFGTLCGTGVSCASGTIVYPGTIVGAGAKIVSTIPLAGYIEPDQVCSFYFIIKKDRNGKKILQPKGTLAQMMREHFALSS